MGRTAMRAWTVPGLVHAGEHGGSGVAQVAVGAATYSGASPSTSSISARPRIVRLSGGDVSVSIVSATIGFARSAAMRAAGWRIPAAARPRRWP